MRRILIIIFTAGWLLHTWLSIGTYFDFINSEAWPRLRGESPLNDFPFIEFSSVTMTIAIVWLALAIIFWSWRATENKDSV